MMLPIPRAGILGAFDGIDDALQIDGVVEITQTIATGSTVVPLPEGDRYLGFLFAAGQTSDDVERSLREGYEALTIRVV